MAFQIGESTVHVRSVEKPGGNLTFVNVHDDENTSVQAGLVNLEQFGGRLIELKHSGKRILRFNVEGEMFAVDPNRIFSDAGITSTLKRHSQYSEAAHSAVREFTRQFFEHYKLDDVPVFVALHNTVDGRFSIKSYAEGGRLSDEASATHINERQSLFNFFFVTDRRFFDYLKDRNHNVALQDNATVTDDGSLSVYFASRNVPYINVEARLGNLSEQVEMLRVLREMLVHLALAGDED
jgi:hypothetical protein